MVLSSVGCERMIEKDKALQAYLGGREGGRAVWATEMLLDFLTEEEVGTEGGREGGRYVLWEGGGGGKEREKLKLAWPRWARVEGGRKGGGKGEGGTQVGC